MADKRGINWEKGIDRQTRINYNRNTKGNKTVCKDAPKPNMPMDDVFG